MQLLLIYSLKQAAGKKGDNNNENDEGNNNSQKEIVNVPPAKVFIQG